MKILVVLDQSDYLEKIQTEAEIDNPAFCIERNGVGKSLDIMREVWDHTVIYIIMNNKLHKFLKDLVPPTAPKTSTYLITSK